MFDVLMSSQARLQLHTGRGILVAAVHGILVAAAVRVAQPASEPARGPKVDTTVFIMAPPLAPEHVMVSRSEGGVVPGPDFDFTVPPIDVPSLPPLTGGPVLDVDRMHRKLPAGPSGPATGNPIAAERILGIVDVDDPAAVLHQPSPRYPPALRVAGIEGRVLVEFVIDTAGHFERGSLRIVERTHAGFEAVVLEALQRSRFTPARKGGVPVRQRTFQSIAFRIRPE